MHTNSVSLVACAETRLRAFNSMAVIISEPQTHLPIEFRSDTNIQFPVSNCGHRYFTEKIRQSWGLSVLKLMCPVCYDPLSFELVSRVCDSARSI